MSATHDRRVRSVSVALGFAIVLASSPVSATEMLPVGNAPISATGLVAGQAFEGWIRFKVSDDPNVPGIVMHDGDSIRITFPHAFTPLSTDAPQAYLLYGWPQGDANLDFTVVRDPRDPRTIVVRSRGTMLRTLPATPGLKAIHLLAGMRNPAPGRYALRVATVFEGKTSSSNETVRIAVRALPTIAPYNGVHGGNEDYQRVRAGQPVPIPLDFLLTDPDSSHPANVTLLQIHPPSATIEIMRGGAHVGRITASGGALLEARESPREGVIRVAAVAPAAPGSASIAASLVGGTTAHLTLRVTP